mmetsp:Transcript_88440/g.175855  ORF Transcript_88440/g.175855 Transcript_88440/m.175855 type:complete len:81 (-) Transcript_88440:158-400(-)
MALGIDISNVDASAPPLVEPVPTGVGVAGGQEGSSPRIHLASLRSSTEALPVEARQFLTACAARLNNPSTAAAVAAPAAM